MSALTQGVGVVTGLQKKFDWAGVAAAGVSSGIMSAVASGYDVAARNGFQAAAQSFGASMAGAVANAASRSVMNGGDFGDNVLAALPDLIGETLGNALARVASSGGLPATPAPGKGAGAVDQPLPDSELSVLNTPPLTARDNGALQAIIDSIPDFSDSTQYTVVDPVHGDVMQAARADAVANRNAWAQVVAASGKSPSAYEAALAKYNARFGGEGLAHGYTVIGGDQPGLNQDVIRSSERRYRFDADGNIGYYADLGNKEANFVVLTEANELANRDANELIFASLLTPVAIGVIPVAATAVAGTTAGGLAYGGTYFGVGGSLNAGLGIWRSYATGEHITRGSVAGDFVTGGINLSFLRVSRFKPVNDLLSGGALGFIRSSIQQRIDAGEADFDLAAENAAEQAFANVVAGRIGDATLAGVNAGRGNWSANFEGVHTRITNGNANSMSMSVAFKAALANQYTEWHRAVAGAYVEGAFAH